MLLLLLLPFHVICQTVMDGSFESASSIGSGSCGMTANQLQSNILDGRTTSFFASGNGVVCYTDGAQAFFYSGSCPGQAPTPINGSYCIGLGNDVIFGLQLSAALVPGNCYQVTFDVRNRNEDGSGNTCNFPARLSFGIASATGTLGTPVAAQNSDISPSGNWLSQQVSFMVPVGATGNNYLTLQLNNQADVDAFLYVDNIQLTTISCATLPVTLVSFDAAVEKNSLVILSWATAIESAFKDFEIERSVPGGNFISIGRVASAGNNSSYQFADRNPINGISYYRLKMNDIDGKYDYSKIIIVKTKVAMIKINPNPVSSRMDILLSEKFINQPVVFQLLNNNGAVVLKKYVQHCRPLEQMDAPGGTASGVYVLQVVSGNNREHVKVVIKK